MSQYGNTHVRREISDEAFLAKRGGCRCGMNACRPDSTITVALLNATVRLIQDVPTLWLQRGDTGVVRSVWLSPEYRYEVEFRQPGQSVTAVLAPEMLELVVPEPTEPESVEMQANQTGPRFPDERQKGESR